MWDKWWLLIPAVVVATFAWRYRTVRVLVAIAAIGAILLFPIAQRLYYGLANQDSSVIEKYTLEYTLASDGRLRTVETLDVRFTEWKHGIFRIFDVEDGTDGDVEHAVTIESIKLCLSETGRCLSEPYETYWENDHYVAKIGTASATFPPGTVNRYVITSTADNAITEVAGTGIAQWYWDVVGAGWAMPIEEAAVTARLPAPPTRVGCLTADGPCAAEERSPRVYTTRVTDLPPRSPVTWQADLPASGLSVVTVTPSSPWLQLGGAIAIGLVLAALLLLTMRFLRERPASTTPVFAEPGPDILPLTWTWREEPPNEPFQTMLLQLRHLSVLDLAVQPEGQYSDDKPEWLVLRRTSAPIPQIAGAAEFLEGLDLDRAGDSVRIDRHDVSVGKKVQATQGSVTAAAGSGAKTLGLFVPATAGSVVHLLASSAGVVSILALLVTQQVPLAVLFAIPAVAGIFSDRSLRTKLSGAGLAARDAVTGLRVALSTKASVERFDYALKARYFAQYLPWAVALDCADKWADACKPDTPQSDSDPAYQSARTSYLASHAVSTAVASVSAGAVAAYAATQSSSGGGGGFSSGGGSGGGGGGSW